MFTLLTTVVSFLSGGFPKILEYFQNKSDNKHELEMAQLQMTQQLELQKLGYVAQKDLEEIKFDEIKEQTASSDLSAALANDTSSAIGASVWVINIRALVRPAITFGLFAIFLFVEIFGCWYAYYNGVKFNDAIQLLWNSDTQTIWASIVGFYFGCRHFDK
jgi:hypothetical protein